jgi:cyclopropane-fatty-acyl-phospholipid synthase
MSSYLSNIVTSPITYGTDLFRSALGGLSWGPALSISKAAVTSLFARIEDGTLILTNEATGKSQVYGQKIAKETSKMTNGTNGTSKKGSGRGKVELTVLKDTFWIRTFLFADMGFAEAYMLGEVECSDLTAFFQVSWLRSFATKS